MARIIYVNAENTPKGFKDGHSWQKAYRNIQDALAIAPRGSRIWVAKGTYLPTDGDNRYASFFLKEGVELYGGFDGTERDLSQRDWEKNSTILSGNIGDPDDPKANSFHVVVGAEGAVLDGFVVTGGNALDNVPNAPWSKDPDAPKDEEKKVIHLTPDMVIGSVPQACGAGMVIYQCKLLVKNCTFKDNVAGKGGGLYVMVSTRDENGGIAFDNEPPTIVNCSFIDNYALKRGGGVSNDMGTHPTYQKCRFINNSCAEKGGGMYNDFGCSPILISCLFAGNSAVMAGAMGSDGNSSPTITNCTIALNRAEEIGAGIYQGTGPSNNPIVTSSIIWGNICENDEANIANWHQCSPVVTFSCVEGGYSGQGNIDQDPMFVDPAGMDFRLASMSPCIDAGRGDIAPERDIDGNPRHDDKKMPTGTMAGHVITKRFGMGKPVFVPPVDMGAYERQEDSVVEQCDVIYLVADNKEGEWDGSSWDNACRSVQKAMDHAFSAGAEVWVAAGSYKPVNNSNREISFMLRKGVEMYGGFKGDETSRNQRDPEKNVTILSGDLGGANSYHVLVGADDALLDGFTISGGCADGPVHNKKGGAMINYAIGHDTSPFRPPIGFSPKLVNCIFRDNYAVDGGAVYNFDRGRPSFAGCTFINNSAGSGGAAMDNVGSFSSYENCTFKENSCRWKGGALFLDYGSRPNLKNCKFENNKAGVHGGAIYTISRASQLESTMVNVDDSSFIKNSSGKRGGAVMNFDSSFITFTGCAFAENHAGKGGGAVATDFDAVTTIKECSFDGNTADQGENDMDKDGSGIVKQ